VVSGTTAQYPPPVVIQPASRREREKERAVTSHLPSMPSRRGRKSPPLQAILVVFVALFILFLWLNFILTQQIESIGREIQVKTKELNRVERRHEALLKEICEVASEQEMANMATRLGYRPQTPVYVAVGRPFVQAPNDALANGVQFRALPGEGDELPAVEAGNLMAVLAREIEPWQSGDGP
jgi:cell division protein FtsB